MNLIAAIKARYSRLPKLVRFLCSALFHVTAPIWGPVVFVLLLAVYLVITPFMLTAEAWQSFK
jgi:hypothetical protein